MTNSTWSVNGEYFETCSCDFLCPCITSNLAGRATHGYCKACLVFHITSGHFGQVTLDGLKFAVVLYARKPSMAEGDIAVGLITDERATPEQQQALIGIGSGQAGGPMAALGPLVTEMLGVEARAITMDHDGLSFSATIPDMLDQAVIGIAGANPDEALYVDNTVHPANTRLGLAKASRSHLHAFGVDWDDVSGNNNGHFAPFSWRAN